MIPGLTAIGQYALHELPTAEDLSTPNPFWAFYDDPYADRIYVLCVQPVPLAAASDVFPYPLGSTPIVYLTDTDKAAPSVLYWANKELLTGASDTPAGINIRPHLENAFSFRASIPLPGGGPGSSAFGYVRVANTGDLDSTAISSAWVGRDATIYIGGTLNPGRADELVLQYKQYQKLYSLQVAGISADERSFDIQIRNPEYKLDIPVQANLYLGDDTDYEGGEDVKGQYKPVALGQCFKVPGVLVDKTNYIYQYHDGSGTTVEAVYDNAIALTLQEDSTDLPNLTVTTGKYATDLSRGLVKVGDEPSSEIVLDCTGVGGTTAASIVNYLAGLVGVTTDTTSINSWCQYQCGFWCDTSGIDIATVMTELTSSCDGWWIFTRSGNLKIGEHTSVSATTSVLTLDGRDDINVVNGIVEGSLRRAPGPAPVWKYSIGYKHYGETVIIDEEILARKLKKLYNKQQKRRKKKRKLKFKYADAVNPDQISDWSQEWRRIDPVSNASVKDYFSDAIDVERDTHLVDQTETTTMATAMLTRDSKLRGRYTFKISRDLYKLFPGDVVTVKHDRLGLSAGKKGRVISIVEDAASEITQLEVLIDE